jgi:hypothetical protein
MFREAKRLSILGVLRFSEEIDNAGALPPAWDRFVDVFWRESACTQVIALNSVGCHDLEDGSEIWGAPGTPVPIGTARRGPQRRRPSTGPTCGTSPFPPNQGEVLRPSSRVIVPRVTSVSCQQTFDVHRSGRLCR